jgi:hypothetical protein
VRGAWERAQKTHAALLSSVAASPALSPLIAIHKASAVDSSPALLPEGFFAGLASAEPAPTTPQQAQQQPIALLQRLVDASFIPSLLRQFIDEMQKVR